MPPCQCQCRRRFPPNTELPYSSFIPSPLPLHIRSLSLPLFLFRLPVFYPSDIVLVVRYLYFGILQPMRIFETILWDSTWVAAQPFHRSQEKFLSARILNLTPGPSTTLQVRIQARWGRQTDSSVYRGF